MIETADILCYVWKFRVFLFSGIRLFSCSNKNVSILYNFVKFFEQKIIV